LNAREREREREGGREGEREREREREIRKARGKKAMAMNIVEVGRRAQSA